jgi:hypothetical protein
LDEKNVECRIEADLRAAHALFWIENFGPRLDGSDDFDFTTTSKSTESRRSGPRTKPVESRPEELAIATSN